jgi:hypothetical protein
VRECFGLVARFLAGVNIGQNLRRNTYVKKGGAEWIDGNKNPGWQVSI